MEYHAQKTLLLLLLLLIITLNLQNNYHTSCCVVCICIHLKTWNQVSFNWYIHNIYSNCIYHWTTRIYLQIIYPDLGISVQWVRVKKRIAQSWWNISFKFHNQVQWSTDCCTKYHNNMVGMYLTHKSVPFFFLLFLWELHWARCFFNQKRSSLYWKRVFFNKV